MSNYFLKISEDRQKLSDGQTNITTVNILENLRLFPNIAEDFRTNLKCYFDKNRIFQI